jgi:hypothetical protein
MKTLLRVAFLLLGEAVKLLGFGEGIGDGVPAG